MSDTQNPVTEVYAVFIGDINQGNVGKITEGLIGAYTGGTRRVHLLFQSFGGFVGDGVFLYNFLRAHPMEVIIYNSGSVNSIAAVAYLGAKERKVSPYGAFMIHRSHVSPQAAIGGDKLQAITNSLAIDDERTEAILRAHITMPDDQWTVHRYADLYIGAKQAVSFGFADEVAEFSPPLGQPILQIR
jgi:ATP-dependent Clp protease protease subunit